MTDWSKQSVLEMLRQQAKDGRARAQVFLHSDLPHERLAGVVAALVAEISLAGAAKPPHIGKVSRLAKSFGIEADLDTMRRLADSPLVKSLLPEVIEDVYPKPVKRPEK